jgi:hypothetical protein
MDITTKFPVDENNVRLVNNGSLEVCLLMVINYLDVVDTQRTLSIFRICFIGVQRFRKYEQNDEYAEWDYEG